MRFIHTADLHLDAPFQGVSAQDERVRSALVDATYSALASVVDLALDRQVHFVVIAGDVYNTKDKSLRAQLRFQAAMERLAEAGIQAFVAQGNHDPANGWSAGLALPDRVRYFPTDRVGRFEVERDGQTICAVYGRSYGRAAETDNLARTYVREPSDELAIGVLHANVGGNTDHEPYAPCSIEDLKSVGMDYWALGHIHKPGVLVEQPQIAYAGSPQGLNPKEDGIHGCYVVELTSSGSVAEFVPTASVRWFRSSVDVASCEDLADVREVLADACGKTRSEAGSCNGIVRYELTGRSNCHTVLARPGVLDDLVEEMRADQLAEEPWLWLDRVRDLTKPPLDLERVRAGADFAADLVDVADRLSEQERAAEELVGSIADRLAATLPGYRPSDDAETLIARARDACLDLLLNEESEQ